MDRRLLDRYNRELQHLREVGAEFAKEYPKIASRLGMEGIDCADPYVERLLESFAFLAARVQLKIDAEFPRFTQHLLETVHPGYAAPVPSMTIVRFEPDTAQGIPPEGARIPRGSTMRSTLGKGEQTACEYRTAQDVMLWPVQVTEAKYLRFSGSVAGVDLPPLPEVRSGQVRAGIQVRLKTVGGVSFEDLRLDKLAFHLMGGEDLPGRLHEQIAAHTVTVIVRPTRAPAPWHKVLGKAAIRPMGFDDDEALLPVSSRQFSGYRMLQEYFTFPQRFLFFELSGLAAAAKQSRETELDVLFLLDRVDPILDGNIDASQFALFCTPAVNLFPHRCDRIHLNTREYEHLVVPDRTRPMDFEVYDVLEVAGYAEGGVRSRTFRPFYATRDLAGADDVGAYFSMRRTPRQMSERQQTQGPRAGYLGGEVFCAIVDTNDAPFRPDLDQLAIEALCTNRDLPLLMPVGQGTTDFSLISGAPVKSVRVIAGPTRPRGPIAEGEAAWRLIGHLSLNYLSLLDQDAREGAVALREMLALYGDLSEPAVRKQVEGVRSIAHKPVLRRVTQGAATSWVRGLEIAVTLDESAFQVTGAYLLAAVLERFFSRYVSINSFTETVLRTVDRGEVARWPAHIGGRTLL